MMTAAQESFTLFTTIILTALFYKADTNNLPKLSGLTYKWVEPFAVNLSWTLSGENLSSSTCCFCIKLEDKGPGKPAEVCKECQRCTPSDNHTFKNVLTEGRAGEWNASVHVCKTDCSVNVAHKSIRVLPRKTVVRLDELVKDFKCLFTKKLSNCSWIPAKASDNLTVSYGHCNELGIKVCDGPHSVGGRNTCVLDLNPINANVCVCVENVTTMSTFQAIFEIPLPKMIINESGGYLNLEWEPPEIDRQCLEYSVTYKECNVMKGHPMITEEGKIQIVHNKACSYEFDYIAKTKESCLEMIIRSDTMYYGMTASPDKTMTIIAIVIPIILSACVILSCFCFRRHRSIICPILPDPSQIFKDFMNGNKQLKIPPNEPETEIFVPCEISPVSEISILQQTF